MPPFPLPDCERDGQVTARAKAAAAAVGVQLEEPEADDPSYTFMGYNTLSVARLRCVLALATGAYASCAHH